MRHALMDPRFPNIVDEWARCEAAGDCDTANDNRGETEDAFFEIFLLEIARRDLEATRAW